MSEHYTREEALNRLHEISAAFERAAMWLGLAADELSEIERIIAPSGRFQKTGVEFVRKQIERFAAFQAWAHKLSQMTAHKFPPPAPEPETQPDQEK